MGIEPTANWLRANCSTTELLTHTKRNKDQIPELLIRGLSRTKAISIGAGLTQAQETITITYRSVKNLSNGKLRIEN